MYGVYYINANDDVWTLLEAVPGYDKAVKLMTAFRKYITENYTKPPYCVAVSQGHIEKHVGRNELRAIRTERDF
jgi:hypothetical protein